MNKAEYRNLPGVDKVLQEPDCQGLIRRFGLERVTEMVRSYIDQAREEIEQGSRAKTITEIIHKCEKIMEKKTACSLKPVINGSGIVLHTNLGRAPLGDKVISDLQRIVSGYSNLEFDLESGKRGHRNDHVRDLLKEITGAEDAVVVNNNAAAVMLILKTLAEGREVIISRGELIEIGGSFRIPDIMAASGAKMVEVGCTNRTKLDDYRQAITDETKIIFKAHKSNYFIGGFSEEVELAELVELAHQHDLMVVYDIGSGLLRKPVNLDMGAEPDVRSALATGVDLICFSGDKLLGGPQAGIIAGKSVLIKEISKAPLMRVLRVGKMTISVLISVMQAYLNDEELFASLPIFALLNRDMPEKQKLAEELLILLDRNGITAKIVESQGRCGGGTMPHLEIPSLAVQIVFGEPHQAEIMHHKLLQGDFPILGILREGELLFDVLCLQPGELPVIADQVAGNLKSL